MPCRIHGYPSDTCQYCMHTLKTQIYQVKHKYTHHRYCSCTLEAHKYLALTCIAGTHKDTHHTCCRHRLQTHRDSVKIQIYPSHRDCSYTHISHALQVYTKIPITQVTDIHYKHTEIADVRSDSSKLKS